MMINNRTIPPIMLLVLLLAGCASAATDPPRQTTELPAATALPSATELPAATALPRATGLPAATALPRSTELPTATALPRATDLPAATALPRATGLPAAQVEPGSGETLAQDGAPVADVTAVRVSGEPGAYQLSVEISSPDTGCEQFADWWEVVDEDGRLLYRRILLHSHVTEQPFTRFGGPVAVDGETAIIVRAHMNNGGYGGQAFRGTAAGGLEPVELAAEFAADLEDAPPLPEGCAF